MRQYLVLFTAVLFSMGAKAQMANSLSLNGYGGYTFRDKVDFDIAYAYANAAFQYGGGLEYFIQRTNSVEIKYLRMDTHLPLYLANNTHVNSGNDKGSVQYILADFTEYFGSSSSKAVPYGGLGLGAGIVSIKDGNSTTKFAWDAKLGVKIKTASALSINLQAYMQSIISTFGSDYWVYPGGAVVAVPDYATLFQFGLGAVLSYNFSKHQ